MINNQTKQYFQCLDCIFLEGIKCRQSAVSKGYTSQQDMKDTFDWEWLAAQ
jgi:hypothetical protein